jgi:hypothetical protein
MHPKNKSPNLLIYSVSNLELILSSRVLLEKLIVALLYSIYYDNEGASPSARDVNL